MTEAAAVVIRVPALLLRPGLAGRLPPRWSSSQWTCPEADRG